MAYKYISRKGKIHGYYSGETFANRLGFSTQVPMRREIVTNNIAVIVQNITIGKRNFLIRKSKIKITNENVHVLQLLDFVKKLYLDKDDYELAKEKIKRFAALTKSQRPISTSISDSIQIAHSDTTMS